MPVSVENIELKNTPCGEPDIKPPHNLFFQSIYDEESSDRTIIDIQAQKKYREQSIPFVRFENKILLHSNRYLTDKNAHQGDAICTLNWLYHWASNDALLGKSNEAGDIMRQWSLASLASAYAQIKSEELLDNRKKQLIDSWLKNITEKVIKFYPVETTIRRKKNNHLYWAAWAVTISGITLNNEDYFQWGINHARETIEAQILPDGTLPLELQRGSKALQYHHFAIMPLVMIAEAGLQNNIDLYEIEDGLLHIAVKRVLKGLDNPKYFNKKTKQKQEQIDFSNKGLMAWIEVYQSRFPTYSANKRLKHHRPFISRRLGGNTTLLYYQK